jgi:hypothetical protein
VDQCKSDKDWFKKPITAKELNADAFEATPQVKQAYDSFQLASKKDKKQSEDAIKKQQQNIEIKYWGSNPLEAAKDELIGLLYGTGNNQHITGF